jgi:hypothetical protein
MPVLELTVEEVHLPWDGEIAMMVTRTDDRPLPIEGLARAEVRRLRAA